MIEGESLIQPQEISQTINEINQGYLKSTQALSDNMRHHGWINSSTTQPPDISLLTDLLKRTIHFKGLDDFAVKAGSRGWEFGLFSQHPDFASEENPFQPLPKDMGSQYLRILTDIMLNPNNEFKPLFGADGKRQSFIGAMDELYNPFGVEIRFKREAIAFKNDQEKAQWIRKLCNGLYDFTVDLRNINENTIYSNSLVENNFKDIAWDNEIPTIRVKFQGKELSVPVIAVRKIKGKHAAGVANIDGRVVMIVDMSQMLPLPHAYGIWAHEIDHIVRRLLDPDYDLKEVDQANKVRNEGTAEATMHAFYKQQQQNAIASKESDGTLWSNIFEFFSLRQRWKFFNEERYRENGNDEKIFYGIGGIIASKAREQLSSTDYFRLFYQDNIDNWKKAVCFNLSITV